MTKAQITQRQRAVAAALGSVRAEGLEPSSQGQKRLNDYANGKITAAEARAAMLAEHKNAQKG